MTTSDGENDDQGSFVRQRKQEILEGNATAVPVSFRSLKQEAEEILDEGKYGYVAGGAGAGETKRANREGFRQWRIVPRALRDVSERDLSTTLLGETLPAPLLLAPVGRQCSFHEKGELATARAATSLEIPLTLSTWASHDLENVADCMGDTLRLFQLYWVNDRDITASLVQRAERAGYSAIVLTVDSRVPKWRTRNLENRYARAYAGKPMNFVTDPVVQERFGEAETNLSKVIADAPEFSYDLTLTWEDLDFLREHTRLPILLKGILHPEDAVKAVEYGADGIIVSTHGGRQIDGGIGAVEALPSVVKAVDDRVPVLLDSGIRSAADTFKAIALGADAVFLGRPFVYGLALAGEQGVYEVLYNHLAELDSIFGLSGCTSIDDVSTDALRPAGEIDPTY